MAESYKNEQNPSEIALVVVENEVDDFSYRSPRCNDEKFYRPNVRSLKVVMSYFQWWKKSAKSNQSCTSYSRKYSGTFFPGNNIIAVFQ